MKKIAILLLVMMLSLCFCLVACDSGDNSETSDNNTETEGNQEAETTPYEDMIANIANDSALAADIAYTYVGSYTTSNAMGVILASHIINLFNDGSLQIDLGFFNAMAGNLQESYTGTYTIDGDTLSMDYITGDEEDDARSIETTIENGSFASKLWIGVSYSTEDITYYQVDAISFANADEVYVGSTTDSINGTITASALALYYGAEGSYPEDEGQFILSTCADDLSETITGSYSKEWAGIDSDDMLKFIYSDCEDLVNYNNSYVLATAFTAANTAYSNTLIRIK